MVFLLVALLMIAGSIGFTGCATPDNGANWPAPRLLGKDIQSFHLPPQPTAVAPVEHPGEPTGVLTLRQALALLRNPELASAGWEVRPGEARTLSWTFAQPRI